MSTEPAQTPPQPEPTPFARAMDGNYLSCDYPEDAAHENGNYANKCQCGAAFIGHKRRVICKVCAESPEPAPPQPEQQPNWTNPTPTEWARRAWQAWFEHGGNLLDDVILPLADKLAAAQAEVGRLREAIQNALEVDRTIPRNGTDEVHSNPPQGWMPPGKRREIIDSLRAALDKKEGQP